MGKEVEMVLGSPAPLPPYMVILYTATGAICYWARWGRARLRVLGLARVLELFPMRPIVSARIEFVTFVVLGCFIGIGFVEPINVTQSFSAGFAWVGLITTMQEPDKLGSENNS